MPLKITILVVGSRGDVQPYLALGVELKRRGHSVRIAAPLLFENWIRTFGLEYAPVRFNPQEYLKSPQMQKLMQSRNIIRLLRDMERLMEPYQRSMFQDFWQASQDASAIICQAVPIGGTDIAEKQRIPCICGQLIPVNPTGEFPAISMPAVPWLPRYFRSQYHRWTHLLVELGIWLGTKRAVNRWREQTLGLPVIPRSGYYDNLRAWQIPIIFGFSPNIIPRPADWPAWHSISGYWFLEPDTGWQPPAGLVQFLDSSPAPVFIGFGSMMDNQPEKLTRMAIDALAQAGQRGVLLTGWAGLGQQALPETIYKLESAPFDWLFPQMAAVVHHGGAGTTSAALRCGTPAIITPFIADQFGWGRIVSDLGLSPAPLPIKKLTARRLAENIRDLLQNQEMHSRVAKCGEKIRSEAGTKRAADIVENHCQSKTIR